MGFWNKLGLGNKAGTQETIQKNPLGAKTFPEQRLDRSVEYYNHRVKNNNGYSPIQQQALSKAEVVKQKEVDINQVNWREIPGYYDWVMENAEDLVISLLSEVDLDGHIQVYPGGVIYLHPTGRYFFPSIFFMSAYEYTDSRVPGFILDASRFDNPADVQRFLINNVKRRDTFQFINLELSNYKMGDIIRNPMRELYV